MIYTSQITTQIQCVEVITNCKASYKLIEDVPKRFDNKRFL